jgi:hypothetical protein
MRPVPRSIGRVVMLAATVAGVAGAYNVLGDNTELRTRAQAQACSGRKPPCQAALSRMARSPFFQEFDFRVRGETVRLRCQRSLWLLGPYACAATP